MLLNYITYASLWESHIVTKSTKFKISQVSEFPCTISQNAKGHFLQVVQINPPSSAIWQAEFQPNCQQHNWSILAKGKKKQERTKFFNHYYDGVKRMVSREVVRMGWIPKDGRDWWVG